MPKVLSKPVVSRCEFNDYNLYNKRMSCKTRRVHCARCREIMFISELSNHCHDKHDIDPLTACVTCFGQFTWKRGTKRRQGHHLKQCCDVYIEKYTVRPQDYHLYDNNTTNADSTNEINESFSINLNEPSSSLNEPPPSNVNMNGLFSHEMPSRLSRRISRFEEGIFSDSDDDMDAGIDPDLILEYETYMMEIEDSAETPETEYCKECVAFHENPNKQRIISYPWSEEALRYVGNLNDPVSSPLSLPVDDGQRALRYHQDTGLSRVHLYLNLYLETCETWQWYHFCIYAGAYASFLKLIENQEIYVLEYSCLCSVEKNNSEFDEPRDLFMVHKHLILAVKDKRSFKNSLNHLECPPELQRGREKKFLRYTRKIEDIHHLGNAIAYVSTPSTGCDIYPKEGSKMRHHCINNPVVPHARYLIALLIESGLDKMAQYKFQGIGPMETKQRINNQWYAPVSELGVLNCVPRFQPLNLGIVNEKPEENDLFVHWFNNTKRKVKEFPDDIPQELRPHISWYMSRGINKILNLSIYELYRQGLIQQRRLNEISKNLEAQKAKLEREFQIGMQECRDERDRMLKERQDLKTKIVYSDNEIIDLRDQLSAKDNRLNEIIKRETRLTEQFEKGKKRLIEQFEKEKKHLIEQFEKEKQRWIKQNAEQETRFSEEKQRWIKQNAEQETRFSEEKQRWIKQNAEQETQFSKREEFLIKELVEMKKRFAEEKQC